LKRLLGYSGVSPEQKHTQTAGTYISSYNVGEERKKRDDVWSENYSRYQTEYNQLLMRPAAPPGEIPIETADPKIKNMDELVREHARFRDIELKQYLPQKPPAQRQQQPATPKLKIMGEIAKVDEIIREISLPEESPKKPSDVEDKLFSENSHQSATLSFEDKSSLVTSPFGSPLTPPLIRSGVLANDKHVRWSDTIEHEILTFTDTETETDVLSF
jgi:hypothetical protein